MICSGEQTVLMFKLQNNSLPVIVQIISALEKNETGRIRITADELSYMSGIDNDDIHFQIKDGNNFEYEEQVGYKNHLFIIGGGHCALALSKMMQSMDFYIRLYEDRKDLNTVVENTFVHEKIFVGDYSELKKLIPEGENNYVVVMTFGYRTDDVAVRALAGRNFKYIGVLGSASKMQQLFEEWRVDGLPGKWLDKIYSPVGLQIKSETPEEIAISIAAEIIQVKNG
jgi:xanthine dehydrogenase accessory factor